MLSLIFNVDADFWCRDPIRPFIWQTAAGAQTLQFTSSLIRDVHCPLSHHRLVLVSWSHLYMFTYSPLSRCRDVWCDVKYSESGCNICMGAVNRGVITSNGARWGTIWRVVTKLGELGAHLKWVTMITRAVNESLRSFTVTGPFTFRNLLRHYA